MHRDANETLKVAVLLGATALIVGLMLIINGRPHTTDDGEFIGSAGFVVAGGVACLIGLFALLYAVVGYGVKSGIAAAKEDEEEALARQRALEKDV